MSQIAIGCWRREAGPRRGETGGGVGPMEEGPPRPTPAAALPAASQMQKRRNSNTNTDIGVHSVRPVAVLLAAPLHSASTSV